MPYTTLDTPAIVHRIDSDLDEVVAAVREADPHLRSLILTGGFARGEGTVLDGVPQNDYDFVVVRGFGRPREAYGPLRHRLERLLGLHVDLAAVPAWRLSHAPATVFWYETALRGRVLWGEDLLPRIPIRHAKDLDRGEGLRLLANRAAGLLFATETRDAHAVRIQAAKAILAAFDAQMLAAGHFAPSQAERWRSFQELFARGQAPTQLQMQAPQLAWAFRFKTAPGSVVDRDPDDVWQAARRILLQALPIALRHAGHASLEAAGRSDTFLDLALYALRAHRAKGAHRFVLNPTSQVRVATLRLLDASPHGRVMPDVAAHCFTGIARMGPRPLRTLAALREATRP
ncbi:MAG: nucleotidyltransferase domain-containing protein [Candidatus Thermoplasmatota archaeon]|jgi:predicted nucleotidyltransferase